MNKLSINDEISILRDLTDKSKYELVGIGSGRAVYSSKTNNTVVKLCPYRSGGMLQNQNEADITERGCPYVAKVLLKGEFINVVEKVDVANITESEANRVIEDYHSWCGYSGISDSHKQVGMNAQGKVVIYDYGIPCGTINKHSYDGMTMFFKRKTDDEKNSHILNVIIPELEMLDEQNQNSINQ